MNNKNNIIIIAISLAVFILLGFMYISSQNSAGQAGDLAGFAECISESGAKFYGAFWCSHCQNQKTAFGSAQDKLPYIECSTPDGRGQTSVCTENNISSYPTWVFTDGSRESGELSFGKLAEKTACSL